jgi:hypothetical protein
LNAFIAEGVEYLVVGAYALAAHGILRATGDLDLHIHSTPDNAQRVFRALQEFGAPLGDLTEGDLSTPGTVYQIGLSPNRIDILTLIDGVEFTTAWKNRLEIDVDGITIPVIGREDLIRNKRAVGRPQDLADVERLLEEVPED